MTPDKPDYIPPVQVAAILRELSSTETEKLVLIGLVTPAIPGTRSALIARLCRDELYRRPPGGGLQTPQHAA